MTTDHDTTATSASSPSPPASDRGAHVAAVLVTYRPDPAALLRVVRAIFGQVDALIVVDNGSPEALRSEIVPRLEAAAVRWMPLAENQGIARAQNLGIAHARALGASHVVLLDQDSEPAPDMVARLVAVAADMARDRVPTALVAPTYLDERQTKQIPFTRFRDGQAQWFGCAEAEQVVEIDTAIASGSLIPMEALDAVGGMREEMFIDLVDIEWCLRARARGFRAFGVCGAMLRHSLGESPTRVLGRSLPTHSPLRNYYFYRNAVWLFRQGYVPLAWKRAVAGQLLKRYILFPLAVPPRLAYLRMMTLGVAHGLRGRGGTFRPTGT